MTWFQAPGEPVEPRALTLDRACALRDALDWYPCARLLEARRQVSEARQEELLVIEVEPDLFQDSDYDIRSPERLAIGFERSDRGYPTLLALRRDFPLVPHVYRTPAGSPRMLCLYEDPWTEVRLRWTAAGFLGDIANWLSRTAVGELHGVDQPLEPFLLGGLDIVVFPNDIFAAGPRPEGYVAVPVADRLDRPITWKLQGLGESYPPEAARLYVVPVEGEASVHGALHESPRNLLELVELLSRAKIDLLDALARALKLLFAGECIPRDEDGLLVLARLPRKRRTSGPIEGVQDLAFAMWPLREAALATGHFDASGPRDRLAQLLRQRFDPEAARAVGVEVLRTEPSLDRARARFLSGLDPESHDPQVVLVGAGALGSQLQSHLSRMGWGRWTTIDDDILLPHNVVRHGLGEFAVGEPKASAAVRFSGVATPHNSVERAFAEDVLSAESNPGMLSALRTADLILDASTSIAAGRYLGRDLDSPARRASLFLSPDGRDAVMLMEDPARSLRLDALEAQYYRAVLRDERLARHIHRDGYVRYSAGCRDVTARIGQDDVALASGLLARQVRTAGADAVAAIWQHAPNGAVYRIDVPLSGVIRTECGGWNVVLDLGLVDRVVAFRQERLPNETGGVLLGYFDVPSSHMYLVDVLPAPADSTEHETAFIRGCAGLRSQLKTIEARTAGQVGYAGEWHSHPDGAGVGMSPTDEVLLATVAAEVRVDGLPGIMMIVGPDRTLAFHALGA